MKALLESSWDVCYVLADFPHKNERLKGRLAHVRLTRCTWLHTGVFRPPWTIRLILNSIFMSIPRDVREFLRNYPGNVDDPEASANFEFYSNIRRCRPDHRLIDEIHEQWNFFLCDVLHPPDALRLGGQGIIISSNTSMDIYSGCKLDSKDHSHNYRIT